MIRNLGYACINMTLSEGYEKNGSFIKVAKKDRVFSSRTCRIATFSLSRVSELILQNVKDLYKILEWNDKYNIRLFRISSDIFPFMDHPELGYSIDDLKDSYSIKHWLSKCGTFAQEAGVRLTSHPGPYTCLASPNQDTASKSIASIEMHTTLGELLGLDDFIINIHIGGTYGGDFDGTAKRFIDAYSKLSTNAKRWLTIENDDKESMWSITRLYNMIHKQIEVPIILDIHHWKFCNDETLEEAFEIALSTWNNKTPKIHYSESRTHINSNVNKEKKIKPQAHSDFILDKIPDCDKTFDVMIESKMKELALLKYRKFIDTHPIA